MSLITDPTRVEYEMAKDTKCQSCDKPLADKAANTCRGCGMVVCVHCVNDYDHYMGGKHGKQRKPRKAGKR